MKMTLKAASILTWFNMIFWGFITGIMLLAALSAINMPILLATVLLSAIPLNSFAALKLHQSIRRPTLSLSSQTPVGIRFVGFIALFFGIICLGDGFVLLSNTKEILDVFKAQMSQAPQMAQVPGFKSFTVSEFRWGGVLMLILGLSIVVNMVLNLRLLRWYYLVRKSDAA
jgi:hypothetical protein